VNRPGTEFMKEVKSSASAVRLVRFQRNATDAMLLEFGNLYIRFYLLGEVVPVDAGTSAWQFPFFYTPGTTAVYLGVNYVNITGNNPNTTPDLNPTDWNPLTGTIYEIPTPYVSADLPKLQFVQSGNVITIVHPSYAPRQLTRYGTAFWGLAVIAFGPTISTPQNVVIGAGGSAGATTYWAITAIATETFEESLAGLANAGNKVPSSGAPTTVSWDAVNSPVVAQYYKIYRSTDGVNYGFVGQTSSASFSDIGTTPDYFNTPPQARSVFNATNKYPSAVAYYQQRLMFANSNLEPETVWGSKTGQITNFTKSFPLEDDDAVTFTMVGQQANAVQHLRDLGRLIAFTAGEEKMVEGDEAGILRPDAINPRTLSANGAGTLPPVRVSDSALYQQARGSIVRDLKAISGDSYEGTDLTVFAAHLFQKYSLVDWDYAQNPNSIVWVARSDGTLLGLTYLREHQIWGWHRHDTDGIVENVCVVPENSEDKVYLVVRRTINGATKRYIERLATRQFTDIKKAIFVDCAYPSERASDNPSTLYTVTLTSGGGWGPTDLLTVTKSAGPAFIAADVGNSIFITSTTGQEIEVRFTGFTDATHMTGFAQITGTVPADLQGAPTSSVIKGILTMTGLSHLEGKQVAVFADGFVVASPNNLNGGYSILTVTGGQITLPRPYKFVRVGLPFISDLVTLDLDASGASTVKDRKLLVNRLGLYLEESRGIWAGMPDKPTTADPLNGLQEYKARDDQSLDDPVATVTDFIDINIEARWDRNARQMVRQVDPLPLTVLAIFPIGYLS